MSNELTTTEQRELEYCENVIRKGLTVFIEVADAFGRIHDKRLYRLTHSSFEDYCHNKWGISRSRGYQFVSADKVIKQLSTSVDTLPANEAQARELADLEPEQQAPAWQETRERTGRDQPPAREVRKTVKKRKPAPKPKAGPTYVGGGEFDQTDGHAIGSDLVWDDLEQESTVTYRASNGVVHQLSRAELVDLLGQLDDGIDCPYCERRY